VRDTGIGHGQLAQAVVHIDDEGFAQELCEGLIYWWYGLRVGCNQSMLQEK